MNGVGILEFSRQTENKKKKIYIHEDGFLIGIGSCGFGDREVPQWAIRKLEIQWYSFIQIQGSGADFKSLESEGLKVGSSDV